MMRELNWDDLRIFLSVAREESLTGAAKRLGCDPATAGRRVERLETDLGQGLFAKSPQGYVLSAAGQSLLKHAESMEQAAMASSDAFSVGGDQLEGQIRIGAPDGCANYLLPQVCARIGAENPDLDLQIIAQPRVIDLSKREADLAITVSRPTAGRLTVQKIADYHLSLVAARGYLAAKPPITALDQISDHPVVGYIPDMIFDKELDYLAETGLPAPRYASSSVPVQLNWLRQGVGLGIAHDFALPAAPELVRVLPEQVRLARSFWLVRYDNERRAGRLSQFADALIAGLRQEIQHAESLT